MKRPKEYYKILIALVLTEIIWAIFKPIYIACRFIKEFFIALWEWIKDSEIPDMLLWLFITAVTVAFIFLMMRITGWTH